MCLLLTLMLRPTRIRDVRCPHVCCLFLTLPFCHAMPSNDVFVSLGMLRHTKQRICAPGHLTSQYDVLMQAIWPP